MADHTVQPQLTVLGGGVIEVGLTAKPVTAWGGMGVFAAFAESVERSSASLSRVVSVGRIL